MTVEVNGYMRTRLGQTEFIESHLRDEPSGRTFTNSKSNHATPKRTPEQHNRMMMRFGRR